MSKSYWLTSPKTLTLGLTLPPRGIHFWSLCHHFWSQSSLLVTTSDFFFMFPPPPRNERYLAAARVARGGVLCAPGGRVRLVGRIFRLLIPKPSFHIVSPDNCVQCGTKLTFERSRARFKTAYMYSFSSGPKIIRSYSKSCESCNKSVYSAYFCVKSGNRGRQSSIRHLSPYPPHTPPWPSFTPTILVYNTQIDNTFARPI